MWSRRVGLDTWRDGESALTVPTAPRNLTTATRYYSVLIISTNTKTRKERWHKTFRRLCETWKKGQFSREQNRGCANALSIWTQYCEYRVEMNLFSSFLSPNSWFIKDEEGKKRRQKRRQERKAAAIKERKKRFNQGKRNEGSDSDYSYRSVVSAGSSSQWFSYLELWLFKLGIRNRTVRIVFDEGCQAESKRKVKYVEEATRNWSMYWLGAQQIVTTAALAPLSPCGPNFVTNSRGWVGHTKLKYSDDRKQDNTL